MFIPRKVINYKKCCRSQTMLPIDYNWSYFKVFRVPEEFGQRLTPSGLHLWSRCADWIQQGLDSHKLLKRRQQVAVGIVTYSRWPVLKTDLKRFLTFKEKSLICFNFAYMNCMPNVMFTLQYLYSLQLCTVHSAIGSGRINVHINQPSYLNLLIGKSPY